MCIVVGRLGPAVILVVLDADYGCNWYGMCINGKTQWKCDFCGAYATSWYTENCAACDL